MGTGSAKKILYLRAAYEDRRRAESLAFALAAEGFEVRIVFRKVGSSAHARPVVFVCSAANLRNVEFANEVRWYAEQQRAIVVAYQDLSRSFVRNIVLHTPTVDLSDWNQRDRSRAEFRDLVWACRRMFPAGRRHASLGLAELMERRRAVAARTTLSDAEMRDLQDRSRGHWPDSGRPQHAGNEATSARWPDAPNYSIPQGGTVLHASTGSRRRPARGPVERLDPLRQLPSHEKEPSILAPEHKPATRGMVGDRARIGDGFVEASMFAPDTAQPGERILVQVFLHALEHESAAISMARDADPETSRRDLKTLALEIARGKCVDVVLDADGLKIDHPAQYLVWQGQPRGLQFLVSLPRKKKRGSYYLYAHICVDSMPVGRVGFMLRISRTKKRAASDVRGDSAQRYRYAYLSYALPDRSEVLNCAKALMATHIDYFQDVLSLKPGEYWKPRLCEAIDHCDVFLLFWSSHAKKSKWVAWEIKYALRRRRNSPDRCPQIVPIILEGPPVPRPPKFLSQIHFNDPLQHVVAMTEIAKHRQPARRTH